MAESPSNIELAFKAISDDDPLAYSRALARMDDEERKSFRKKMSMFAPAGTELYEVKYTQTVLVDARSEDDAIAMANERRDSTMPRIAVEKVV